MARRLLGAAAVFAVICVCLAHYEDCERTPDVPNSDVSIEDDDNSVHALYTCKTGYQLQGPAELICDLNTDIWNTDPPICVEIEMNNEVDAEPSNERPRKKKPQDIPEDPTLPRKAAQQFDMSCVKAKVKAPEIEHGYVMKYDRRRKGDHVFLVAFYACHQTYDFDDTEVTMLYCGSGHWVGELPVCVKPTEYVEEDEEGEEDDYEDGYDVVQEGEEGEEGDDYVVPPLPPPPQNPDTHPTDAEEPNEIEVQQAETNKKATPEGNEIAAEVLPVTDVNIVVEPTHDPYTPRVLDDNCGPDKGGCEHRCERLLYPGENEARLLCKCFEGFTLDPNDYSRCLDIDECKIKNGGCEQICNNAPGTFQCSCEQGLQIDTLTGNTCVDINECLLRNGHGPCQDTCYNIEPGYRCTCEGLAGTRLSADNHTCEDAGQCANNNGGCSHICLPALGRVFCLCPGGFHLPNDGKNCIDINECELPEIQAECSGSCENTHGSYRCVPALNNREDAITEQDVEEKPVACPTGFKRNAPDDLECVDIDECAEGTSGCEHCLNKDGGFECTCPAGYDLDESEKHCVDVNECELVIEDENADGAVYKMCSHGCVNTPGSYICECGDNQHLLPDRRNCAPDMCRDLNNPQLNKTRCAYECLDLPSGTYECVCPAGYRLGENLHSCEVAETLCATAGGDESCAPGECRESDDHSSFACVCPPGYIAEGQRCVDIDECATGTHECSDACINTNGSYQCSCASGRRFAMGSERQCEPFDVCQSEPGVCGALVCVPLPGSFACVCADGSAPNPETNACSDLSAKAAFDACAQSGCSHICEPTNESFKCSCPEPLILSDDGLNCLEINPCADDNNGCAQVCAPNEGGVCRCHSGYALADDGKSCLDIDECLVQNGGCHHLCINNAGGYVCACQQGYEFLDGNLAAFCFDIDECALGTHNCGPELVCENLNGSFTCLCPRGFALGLPPVPAPPHSLLASSLHTFTSLPLTAASHATPLACLDIDECSIGNGNCSHFCLNSRGSFQCACPPGYALSLQDNSTCTLENACFAQNGGCSHLCTFVHGTVMCSCRDGYVLGADASTCFDLDECATNNGNCAHICENSEGEFACRCRPGWQIAPNGRDCEDVDECAVGNGNCTFICLNLLGSHACACEAGFELADDGRTCLDVNECALNRHDCSHQCVNTEGAYNCVCPEGYLLGENGVTCLDVDECASEHACSHSCVNTLGSYECSCPESHVLAADKKSCVAAFACPPGTVSSASGHRCEPENECLIDNGGCSHECAPGVGCACPAGLVLASDGKTCNDIDECRYENGGCAHLCVNKHGSYECACSAGYTVSSTNGGQCVDVDECADTPNLCQHLCVNTNGSYECICPRGYQLVNGRACADINECLENNGGCVGGECVNHNGGHECKCPLGQGLALDRRTCERRTELRDQCRPFVPPANGEIRCTKYRHKKKLFYNTKCKVSCKEGYRLQGPAQRYCNASGIWDDYDTRCLPIVCPALPPPRNGNILPASCVLGKTYVGERCRLQCPTGYVPLTKSLIECTLSQQWTYNGTFDCTPAKHETRGGLPSSSTHYFNQRLPASSSGSRFDFGTGAGTQRPFIRCPRNTTVFLAKGEKTAHIILEKPVTNLDFHNIESHPPWTRNLQAHLGVGTYIISFRGHDPITGKGAKCKTVISVRQAQPPVVSFCTPSFEVSLNPNQVYRSVVWEEPRFETNALGLKKLYKSRMPGELFGVGLHTVFYEATNEDGLTSRCEFKILVKAPTPAPVAPLPLIDLGYPGNRANIAPTPLANINLLPGHESYIICPGRPAVKVTNTQFVQLPAGCMLKNVRSNPVRHYSQRRLYSLRWTPFTSF